MDLHIRPKLKLVAPVRLMVGRAADRVGLHMSIGAGARSSPPRSTLASCPLTAGCCCFARQSVPKAHRLPVVLSPDEVTRLLEAARGPKCKAAFSLAYGAPSPWKMSTT
jgi:hypothetical protein